MFFISICRIAASFNKSLNRTHNGCHRFCKRKRRKNNTNLCAS